MRLPPRRLLLAPAALVALVLATAPPAGAQSAQAGLFGRITAGASGNPLARALVILRNQQTNQSLYKFTNEQGLYSFAAVPPGVYSARVDSPPGYQPEERTPVELPVGSRIELNFVLKTGAESVTAAATAVPSSRAGSAAAPRTGASAREVQAFIYGADAAVPVAIVVPLPVQVTETLVGSLSSLIDEREITESALSGRDVYTLLVLQPGVTSDNATGRGLGFSVNGQRSASSNFLLDGVDNNDLLVTGPATKVSADAVKEYRMSTNSYSAEFGRASGFIANAITRSGTNALHGSLYEFFNHDRLNANSFTQNMVGQKKQPFIQHQHGASLGGPIVRERMFYFANFERMTSSSRSQLAEVFVPSPELVAAARGPIARRLFAEFPVPDGDPVPGAPFARSIKFHYPLVQANLFGLGKVDYSTRDSKHRLSARYSISQAKADHSYFSIYPALDEPLSAQGQNMVGNYTRDLWGGSNEFKAGFNRSHVSLLRPHADVATFMTFDGLVLPSSDGPYDYDFRDRVLHFLDNYSRLAGRHAIVAGFEWRQGLHDSLLTPGRDGAFFTDSFSFLRDEMSLLLISLNRFTGRPATNADFARHYSQKEFAGFLQDNLKLTRRLTLNLGMRYEYFGVPAPRKGTRDFNYDFGPGATIDERVLRGRFIEGALYRPDRNNIAPRFGFALDLRGNGKSVLRGGYGIFFDRIFNNFWMDVRANSTAGLTFLTTDPNTPFFFRYTLPAMEGVRPVLPEDLTAQTTIAVDRGLRTPYGQSWFAGFQQELSQNLVLQVDHAGSLGRKLATADNINRVAMPAYVPALGHLSYRANQGTSDFLALQANLVRRWSKGVQFQVSYTLSRANDAQSDPLTASALSDPDRAKRLADAFQVSGAFTRPFDQRGDYGRSAFDQTHNLVFNVIAQAPAFRGWRWVASGWQISALAGFRSGFPFTVFAPGCATGLAACDVISRNRADFIGDDIEDAYLPQRTRVPGGVVVLDRSKFRLPQEGLVGNMPRNALRGPGFWNADFAFSRMFLLPHMGEQRRVQFRAEFFNLLNHTNLNSPDPYLDSDTFGQARFGRQGFASALPSASPLNEQPRRIQFALKFYF